MALEQIYGKGTPKGQGNGVKGRRDNGPAAVAELTPCLQIFATDRYNRKLVEEINWGRAKKNGWNWTGSL